MRVKETKTGKEFHIDRGEIAGILQAAGIIEPLSGVETARLVSPSHAKPTQRTPKTEWTVSRGSFDPVMGELRVAVYCASCGNKSAIFKPTEKATFPHGLHCGGIEPIPADVLEQYRELSEPPKAAEKKRAGLTHCKNFYVAL
jgi:hypothetical protein